MKLSHLNALRALEAALRHGSFTAAATEIGITPAAVGQRVRSLEEYIGRPLFERAAAGLKPTAEACEVLPQLHSGFTAIAAGFDRLKFPAASDTLSVTMPESFAENWFSAYLGELRAACPWLDLQLDASNRDAVLRVEGFDIAIRYGDRVAGALQERTLFGDAVQPVCTPEFAAGHGLTPDRRDLTGVPLIHLMNRTADPGWVGFDGWGEAFGMVPGPLQAGVRFSRAGSALQTALRGQALVMAGFVEAFHALQDGRLVMPFGPDLRCETAYAYRLVWDGSAPGGRARDAFIGWMTAKAAEHRRAAKGFLGALCRGADPSDAPA